MINFNDNTPFDWGSLESDVINGEFRPATRQPNPNNKHAKNQRFPCPQCGGTGSYLGVRIHQPKEHCFACGGKGYFMTSESDRAKARMQATARKAKRLEDDRLAWAQANPGVLEFLARNLSNSFCSNLIAKCEQYGSLTDGQVAAVRRMMVEAAAKVDQAETRGSEFDRLNPGMREFLRDAKWSDFAQSLYGNLVADGMLSERRLAAAVSMRAKCEARKPATQPGAPPVDLSPIRALFDLALQGKKEPAFYALGIKIHAAKGHSANPGALYVRRADTDEYLGKIVGTQYLGKPCPELAQIAKDPRKVALTWGKEKGQCSCCGATLTDPVSIERGIGPICASKWGF